MFWYANYDTRAGFRRSQPDKSGVAPKDHDNTTLERVSYDKFKSAMVCHYKVESWGEANVLNRSQSKHLFCEMIDQKHRGHLFKMADTIELEYRTADGWMQYAFVADKNTCKE